MLWAPLCASAATPMEAKLAEVAEKVAEAVKGLGHDSVSIGQFTGPPQLATSAGPGIAKVLADELLKRDVTVKRRAELGVSGKFQQASDEKQRLIARIEGELIDRSSNVICTFGTEINGVDNLASLFGVTAELPPNQPEKQRNDQLVEALNNPRPAVANTRVSSSDKSPYGVEILVKQAGEFQPRTVTLDEGLPFVQINRGEIYGIRLINDSSLDAAVTLSIDGVNVFAFSDHKEYKHYIIKAGSKPIIRGWHRTNEVSDAFQIGEFAKSAAAETLPTGGQIGTITAMFAAAWPADARPPADEFAAQLKGTRGSDDATIRGPQTEQGFTEVRRHTGVARAAVSVRYTKPDDLPPP
jgi:hypothetical protein